MQAGIVGVHVLGHSLGGHSWGVILWGVLGKCSVSLAYQGLRTVCRLIVGMVEVRVLFVCFSTALDKHELQCGILIKKVSAGLSIATAWFATLVIAHLTLAEGYLGLVARLARRLTRLIWSTRPRVFFYQPMSHGNQVWNQVWNQGIRDISSFP